MNSSPQIAEHVFGIRLLNRSNFHPFRTRSPKFQDSMNRLCGACQIKIQLNCDKNWLQAILTYPARLGELLTRVSWQISRNEYTRKIKGDAGVEFDRGKVCTGNLMNVPYLPVVYPLFSLLDQVANQEGRDGDAGGSWIFISCRFLTGGRHGGELGNGAARAVLLSTRVGVLDQCRGHASFVLHPAPSSSPRALRLPFLSLFHPPCCLHPLSGKSASAG